VAVCSRRQAKTEQERDGENCTLIENKILIRTIVFLGAFGKLRQATISIVMCARPSVRMENFGSHGTYFLETWYFSTFRKYAEK